MNSGDSGENRQKCSKNFGQNRKILKNFWKMFTKFGNILKKFSDFQETWKINWYL